MTAVDELRPAVVTFRVDGLPVAQGSVRAFVAGGRAVVTYGRGGTLGSWRQAIAARAADQLGDRPPVDGPVRVVARFGLRRPRSHYGARGILPRHASELVTTAPDLDKLARALLDALTGVVYRDDRQVVELVLAKRYDDRPGLDVELELLED